MALDQGVFPVIGHGMKIQVEGLCGEQVHAMDVLVPGSQKAGGLAVIDARGIFREIAFLGKGIQAGKQCQSLIGQQGHHMALALDRP